MDQFIQTKGSFAEACKTGNIDAAKLLLELKPNINISAENEDAFRWACKNGHLHVAQWFQSLNPFKYGTNNLYSNDDLTFIIYALHQANYHNFTTASLLSHL